MILHNLTRIAESREVEIATGFAVREEGLALISVAEGGVAKAKPSTSGTSNVVLGLAYTHLMTPTEVPHYGDLAAVGVTLTLPFTPLAGQLYIRSSTGTEQVAGSAANVNEYSIVGNVVTLHSAQSGLTMHYGLKYSPTVEQILAAYGESAMAGVQAESSIQGKCSIITRGRVATSCFDVSKVWTAGVAFECGANGILVPIAGTGTTYPNAQVYQIPSAASPYLIVDIGLN